MAGFNWQYFGFTNFDATWIYRELLLLPIFIAILWFLWMRVVASTRESGLPCTPAMDITEAYQEAIIQDALSTDDEEVQSDEEVTFKKEDLNAKKDD